jgi:hypothetical protein
MASATNARSEDLMLVFLSSETEAESDHTALIMTQREPPVPACNCVRFQGEDRAASLKILEAKP